ncbi:MAG TPA: class I SAM-dependent methyltransferase [Candidatus Dormibacteraeota bacterium]|nr:class I SAM-dependent methyltransferase [Candidatus Dormibacteraeota bacterium]
MSEDAPYLLPRHAGEIDRLDLQHYAIRVAMDGATHRAPVRSPALVLDVGAGSGQWGWDITEEFTAAHVVGVDLVPGKPRWPERYQPVRANLLHGLPFLSDRFDLVHQRLLFLGIPAGSWHAVAHDLIRVTRPGGWIELMDGPVAGLDNAGPAIDRLLELAVAAADARGLDTSGKVYQSLDGYLRLAGAVNVERRELRLPVGEWGGQVGSLLATDLRVGFIRMLEARSEIGRQERTDLLRRVQEEYERRQVTWTLALVHGRKPEAAR